MSSIRQIAKQAGLSVATVSRALNNDPVVNEATRKRVLAVANAVRYSATIGRRSSTIVALAYVAVPFHRGGGYDSELMMGIMRGLDEQKFDVMVLNLQRDKMPNENYTQFFMRKGVRGVLLRSLSAGRPVCEQIALERFPHVVIGERFASSKVNFTYCDSYADSRRAVEHLIDLGHKRIGFCSHDVPDQDHQDRENAYREIMNEAGLPIREDWIVRIGADLSGGAQAFTRLVSLKEPPTAVFCADPLLTLGFLQRAHELGLHVPQEFSVVGFDDADARHMSYPIFSAVRQSAAELGYEAALWLTRSLTGESNLSFRKVVATSFELNATTSSPPNETVRLLPNGIRLQQKPDARK